MRSMADEGRVVASALVAIAGPSADPRFARANLSRAAEEGTTLGRYNPNSFAICCFSLYFSTLLVGVTGSASTKRMCFGIM